MYTSKMLAAIGLVIASISSSVGQPSASQEKLYALSIISFAKSTNWPTSTGKCVIGVWDYGPLASELVELAKSRNVNGNPVEVRQVSDIRELADLHVLFLPSYKHRMFSLVLEKLEKLPVLVVTNEKDVARSGGCIDIILVNGKLNYEINAKAIERRGMKVTMALKNMGTIVD